MLLLLPVGIVEDAPFPVVGFHEGAHGFHPVAAVEVVDGSDHFIGRLVDVAADDAVAMVGLGHFAELFFVVGDERHGRFHFGFHHLGEGVVGQAAAHPVLVVVAVEPEEEGVAHIAQFSQPFELGGNGVEDIAVHHEIFFSAALQDVGAFDDEGAEGEGEDFVEEIVVVAPQVDHFGVVPVEVFHEDAEELGVFFLPLARFAELPAVHNVAVEDERVAFVFAEEGDHFFHPGVADAEVEIGEDDGAVMGFHNTVVVQSCSALVTAVLPACYACVNKLLPLC